MSFPILREAFAEHSIQVAAIALDAQHAIELAGNLLVASGRADPDYVDQMVGVLGELGPYFVLAPGIAIAHAKASSSVFATGLSLVTLAEPVVFGNAANDPVELVIGMCATITTVTCSCFKSLPSYFQTNNL